MLTAAIQGAQLVTHFSRHAKYLEQFCRRLGPGALQSAMLHQHLEDLGSFLLRHSLDQGIQDLAVIKVMNGLA